METQDDLSKAVQEQLIWLQQATGLTGDKIATLLGGCRVSPEDISCLKSLKGSRVGADRKETIRLQLEIIRQLISEAQTIAESGNKRFLRRISGFYRGFWRMDESEKQGLHPLLLLITPAGTVHVQSMMYHWKGKVAYCKDADSLEINLSAGSDENDERRAFLKSRLLRTTSALKPCQQLSFAFISDYEKWLLAGKAIFFRRPDDEANISIGNVNVEGWQTEETKREIDAFFSRKPNNFIFTEEFIAH